MGCITEGLGRGVSTHFLEDLRQSQYKVRGGITDKLHACCYVVTPSKEELRQQELRPAPDVLKPNCWLHCGTVSFFTTV